MASLKAPGLSLNFPDGTSVLGALSVVGSVTVGLGLVVTAGGCNIGGQTIVTGLLGAIGATTAIMELDTTSGASTDATEFLFRRGGVSRWRIGTNISGGNVDALEFYNDNLPLVAATWAYATGVLSLARQLALGALTGTPADGSIWWDGTNFKGRMGGVTKTFTLT